MWIQGGMRTWGHLCSQATTELCLDLSPLFNGHSLAHCLGYTVIRLTGPLS